MRHTGGVLDAVSLDRLAAGATFVSPVIAWLSLGSPTGVEHDYPVSLVLPLVDLVACALLSAGAVVFYRAGSWLGIVQWLVVGALLAVCVLWGFSLGRLFTPTLMGASIAAVLSDGNSSRSITRPIIAVLIGVGIHTLVLWAIGYLHFANVNLSA